MAKHNTSIALGLFCAAAVLGACSDDKAKTRSDSDAQVDDVPSKDAASGTGKDDAYDAGATDDDASTAADDDAAITDDDAGDCFTNPVDNDQIINACTDAEKVDKQPLLPLLLDDGGLPPLP